MQKKLMVACMAIATFTALPKKKTAQAAIWALSKRQQTANCA